MNDLTMVITAVGVIAFAVSVVTEVIKGVSFFKAIPTDLVVFVLSIAFSVAALFAYASYAAIVITWYYIAGAVIAGFVVAFVAMYGWDKLHTLWDRFKK